MTAKSELLEALQGIAASIEELLSSVDDYELDEETESEVIWQLEEAAFAIHKSVVDVGEAVDN